MVRLVVIINGVAQCGKDTLCEWTSEFINSHSFSVVQPIKDFMRNYGYDESDKSEQDRIYLSELIQLLDEWMKTPEKDTRDCIFNLDNEQEDSVLFVHIRQPKIIREVKDEILLDFDEKIPVKTLLVKSDRAENNCFENGADNVVYDFKNYDWTFDNSYDTIEESKKNWFNFVVTNILPYLGKFADFLSGS